MSFPVCHKHFSFGISHIGPHGVFGEEAQADDRRWYTHEALSRLLYSFVLRHHAKLLWEFTEGVEMGERNSEESLYSK
jgi:hypothetical protein